MKRIKLLAILLLFGIQVFSQIDFYKWELQNLSDISRLPEYRTGNIYQLSSYDRTGGNDDGFSGRYSYIRKEGNDLVVADKGQGLLTGYGLLLLLKILFSFILMENNNRG